nr:unnamed protein product [Callosobruchus analis]
MASKLRCILETEKMQSSEDKYQTIAMDPYEKEIARLRALYEEVLADEAAGLMENDTLGNEEAQDSDGSILVDGEDIVIFSDHDSDTEQEGDILDEIPSEARVFEDADPRLYYYGKDGTKWKKTAPPKIFVQEAKI